MHGSIRMATVASVLVALPLALALQRDVAAQTKSGKQREQVDALAFVQKYKGLYASEIVDDFAFSKTFKTRTNISLHLADATYDDASRVIAIAGTNLGLKDQAAFEKCVTTGTATGRTAFGVTVSYVKETCHRIFLRGNDDKWFGDRDTSRATPSYLERRQISFQGTPAQYRDIKSRGFDIEVTFMPVKTPGLVVEHDQAFHSAKIDDRVETTMNVYRLTAKVLRIEYFFPSSKQSFRTDTFD